MSDYYGALLRSAGAAAVPAALPRDPFDAGWGEQNVEVESAAAARASARAESDIIAAGEPATMSPTAPVSESVAPTTARRNAATWVPAVPAAKRIELGAAEAHPMVRAALDWVAADPTATATDRFELDAVTPDAAPQQRRQAAQPTTRVATTTPTTARAEPALVTTARAMTQGSPDDSNTEPRGAEIEPTPKPMTPPRPTQVTATHPVRQRPDPTTVTEFAEPAPPDRVDVHIGTIHVRIDAPPAPRVVAQPAPAAPPRATPAAPPQRSGFSRSRVPRF